ncbi:MAG: hypothetical protein ACTSQH_10985 [Candidatus Hodarchaeales archaeon]
MLSITEISIALVIGGGTGLILQRGRVCANTGFRNILLSNNVEIAGIFLLAVAVEMIGYFLLYGFCWGLRRWNMLSNW